MLPVVWLLVLAVVVSIKDVAPVSAQEGNTFDDIGAAGVHAPSVAALADAGVLEGTECAVGRFCPNEPIERWMMAVWLVRAVDGQEPSPASTSRFADVDTRRWWAPHVERLAELGITSGCAGRPARYCPDDSVNRGQMATFLTRAFGRQAGPSAGFADTAGNTHAANIDALAAAGITAGCATNPLRYCPKKAVTRAQMATFLARALGLVPLPEITHPTPARLAYTRVSGSASSVVVVDADGSSPRSVAEGASGPIWSPDGARILYRGVPWPDYGIWPDEVGLWVVDADGSNRRQIATGGPHPVWSPDSARILYRAGGWSGDLSVVDVDGANRRRLGHAAVWSPDGSRIVYSSGEGMFVTDAAGTRSRRIADAGSTPQWWPEDTRIFYKQSEDLWVVADDGSGRRRLGTGLRVATLSPDATQLAWNGHIGGVWVMNTDGSGRKQLTEDGWRPAWAPDGTRLFATYHDFEGWPLGLLAVDAKGSILTEITPGKVFDPLWLPDSRSIAYLAEDLYILDIGGDTRRLTNDRTQKSCLVLSPAGNQVSYRDEHGIYLINTDGTNHTQLDTNGECPTWSPPAGPPDDGEPPVGPPDDGEPPVGPPDDGEPPVGPPDDGEPPVGPPDDGEPPVGPPDDGEPPVLLPGEGLRIRMARAQWSTGYFQAALYRALLEELGYEVTDPASLEMPPSTAYLALAGGDFDLWVNGWFPSHDPYLDATMEDGSRVHHHVTIVGQQMIAGGTQGFVVTDDFAHEYAIETLDDLDQNPAALTAYDAVDVNPGNGVAEIYGCPQPWLCDDIIDSMIAFSGWNNIRQVTAPYDAMFAEAVARVRAGRPAVLFVWMPSEYISAVAPGRNTVWIGVDRVLDNSNPLRRPDGENWDQRPGTAPITPDRCPDAATRDTCQLGWLVNDIRVAANNDFLQANPPATALLEAVQLDPIDVSHQIVLQSQGTDVADLVTWWIADHRNQVNEWLTRARAAN